MSKTATPLPQAPAADVPAPVADPFAAQKAEAEALGSKAVMDMPTLIKGASVALRVDH